MIDRVQFGLVVEIENESKKANNLGLK